MPKLSSFIDTAYIRKAKLIDNLSRELFACLPSEFLAHCHIVNLNAEQSELLICCDSPVWANKLRYYRAEIMRYFQLQHQGKLKNIKISVSPKPFNYEKLQKRPHISSYSAQKLKSLAMSLPDSPLRISLMRLTRHR